MKTNQNGWTPRRPRSFVRPSASLCLLFAIAWPVPSFSQGTAEQRQACTPDVFRLCSAFIPSVDDITACLRERNSDLSDACRQAIRLEIKQPPSVKDGAGGRKHPTR